MVHVTCLRRELRPRMRQAVVTALGPAHPACAGTMKRSGPARDRARRRGGLLAAGLAAVALLAAACGGARPGSPGVADAGSSSASGSSSPSSSASHDPLAFARCMRAHGVTDFPDSGGLGQASPGSDLDPANPTYRAAWQACQALWPTTHVSPAEAAQALADGLKFSACMREHGITSFPDPDPHGGPHGHGGIDLRGLGIDPNSPQFRAAQQACQHYLGPNGKGG
jgi:hypothetical protein